MKQADCFTLVPPIITWQLDIHYSVQLQTQTGSKSVGVRTLIDCSRQPEPMSDIICPPLTILMEFLLLPHFFCCSCSYWCCFLACVTSCWGGRIAAFVLLPITEVFWGLARLLHLHFFPWSCWFWVWCYRTNSEVTVLLWSWRLSQQVNVVMSRKLFQVIFICRTKSPVAMPILPKMAETFPMCPYSTK